MTLSPMRSLWLPAVAAVLLLTSGCIPRWTPIEDANGGGERIAVLNAKYQPHLAKVADYLNQKKVAMPFRETRLYNRLGFTLDQNAEPMLSITTYGNTVRNDQTHYVRAVSAFSEDAKLVLKAFHTFKLLEKTPDYQTVHVGLVFRATASEMTSEIGGVVLGDSNLAEFYIPVWLAKSYVEGKAPFKELVTKSAVRLNGERPADNRLN